VNRKFKILKLKHDYLKLELEDVREDFDNFTEDFNKYFDKYYSKSQRLENEKNQKDYENPATHFENAKKERERKKKELEQQRAILKDSPRKVKNLYKRLAAKTHPDKLGGKTKKFQYVKDAYERQDLATMLELAAEHDVNYKFDERDELLMRKNLTELQDEIDRIKGTIGWLWGKGDVNQRRFCVERVESETKLKVDNEDLPDDLKKKKTKLLKDEK
tara:strand:- start:1199 stop:1849 length:651 start_codon:yes stop_codon:yes gene_type:complete